MVILDKVPSDKELNEKYLKLKEKLEPSGRFVELSKSAIEDYYPEDFKRRHAQLLEQASSKDWSIKGVAKAELAKKLVDEELNNKEAFSHIFQMELDFLIREN
jgi:hypothetical protein